MKKKFICTVCGYIHEGTEAPEKCPLCKAPATKFNEMKDDDQATFATVHELGAAKTSGADEEMIKDLNTHFNGDTRVRRSNHILKYIMSVATTPGSAQFTVIPLSFSSLASFMVKSVTASFELK